LTIETFSTTNSCADRTPPRLWPTRSLVVLRLAKRRGRRDEGRDVRREVAARDFAFAAAEAGEVEAQHGDAALGRRGMMRYASDSMFTQARIWHFEPSDQQGH